MRGFGEMGDHKFSFAISDENLQRLNKAVSDSGLYSELETINAALEIFEWAIGVVSRGGEIGTLEDGDLEVVRFKRLDNARPPSRRVAIAKE
jgi:hypothetical protein